MNGQNMLRENLPKMQTRSVLAIHYVYLLAFYYFISTFWTGKLPIIHGILFLTGLYTICLFKNYYFNNLILIISGFLIVGTVDVLFCYFADSIFGGLLCSSLLTLVGFLMLDIKLNRQKGVKKIEYIAQWYYVALPAVIYIYGATTKAVQYKIVALFLVIVWLIVHFVSGYLKGLEKFCSINEDVQSAPYLQIYKRNTTFMTYMLCGLVSLLLLAMFFQYDGVFYYIARAIIQLFIGIASIFAYILMFFDRLGLLSETMIKMLADGHFFEELAQSKWIYFLEIWVLILAGFVLFIFMKNTITFFERKIKKEEQSGEEKSVPKENAIPDIIESLAPSEKKIRFTVNNNRDKVRYLFYKKVKKKYKNFVPAEKTAHELLGQPFKSDNLASLYDVARYTDHDIPVDKIKSVK